MDLSRLRTCAWSMMILLAGQLLCMNSHAEASGDEYFEVVEAALNELIRSDSTKKFLYDQCVARSGDGAQALACVAANTVELELISKVCSQREEEISECYATQKNYKEKYLNLVSTERSPMFYAAASTCSDLYGFPMLDYQLRLYEYALHIVSNDVAVSVEGVIWYDYESLVLCTEEMYKKMVIQQFQ